MFTDPQSVTVNSVAQSMPRVLVDGTSATYQKNDETWKLIISHQKASKDRIRSMVRLEQRAIVTNPLDATSSDYDTLSFYCVLDRPSYGFTLAQCQQIIAGLQAWLDATAASKLYGQES